jgi:hypothetical protein
MKAEKHNRIIPALRLSAGLGFMRIKKSTEQRIKEAMGSKTTMQYHDLMRLVFPPEKYPNAYNYSVNGGPPGCAMTFGSAIKRMGGRDSGMGGQRMVEIPPNAMFSGPRHEQI